MAEHISVEPRLFVGSKEGLDTETLARVNRLDSLAKSIARRPGIYKKAFEELGLEATAETLDIHHDAVETRDVTSDPKKRIKEYFTKRDDQALELDEESDKAIFGSPEFKELAQISREKTSIVKKKSIMSSVVVENPEAREASNAVRRYILGTYIGRAVLWEAQQESKKVKQAG